MASTISGINIAQVEARVVAALRQVLPVLRFFSLGIDKDESVVDDKVYVPIATDPTIATKTAGTLLTAGGSLAGSLVTLDTFRGAAWDAIEGKMRSDLFAQYWADKAAGAVHACAKDVIDAALALVTAANFSNAEADKLIAAPADFGQLDVATLWGKGVTKIKSQKRNMVLNTAYMAAAFGDGPMALAFASAGVNVLASGQIPSLLGMSMAHYDGVPTNSENLGGMVIGQAALLVALGRPSMLIQSGEGNVVDRRIITEPDSGVSAMYTVQADAGGTVTGEVALLYGVAKGQNAVVRLLSA